MSKLLLSLGIKEQLQTKLPKDLLTIGEDIDLMQLMYKNLPDNGTKQSFGLNLACIIRMFLISVKKHNLSDELDKKLEEQIQQLPEIEQQISEVDLDNIRFKSGDILEDLNSGEKFMIREIIEVDDKISAIQLNNGSILSNSIKNIISLLKEKKYKYEEAQYDFKKGDYIIDVKSGVGNEISNVIDQSNKIMVKSVFSISITDVLRYPENYIIRRIEQQQEQQQEQEQEKEYTQEDFKVGDIVQWNQENYRIEGVSIDKIIISRSGRVQIVRYEEIPPLVKQDYFVLKPITYPFEIGDFIKKKNEENWISITSIEKYSGWINNNYSILDTIDKNGIEIRKKSEKEEESQEMPNVLFSVNDVIYIGPPYFDIYLVQQITANYIVVESLDGNETVQKIYNKEYERKYWVITFQENRFYQPLVAKTRYSNSFFVFDKGLVSIQPYGLQKNISLEQYKQSIQSSITNYPIELIKLFITNGKVYYGYGDLCQEFGNNNGKIIDSTFLLENAEWIINPIFEFPDNKKYKFMSCIHILDEPYTIIGVDSSSLIKMLLLNNKNGKILSLDIARFWEWIGEKPSVFKKPTYTPLSYKGFFSWWNYNNEKKKEVLEIVDTSLSKEEIKELEDEIEGWELVGGAEAEEEIKRIRKILKGE